MKRKTVRRVFWEWQAVDFNEEGLSELTESFGNVGYKELDCLAERLQAGQMIRVRRDVVVYALEGGEVGTLRGALRFIPEKSSHDYFLLPQDLDELPKCHQRLWVKMGRQVH